MKAILLILATSFSFGALSQSSDHFSWLTGTWRGPGFGGNMEEVWSEPDPNGDLMCMFRYSNMEDEIQFYEFWILNETGLKLRHFNPDFTAWEAKEDFLHFKMIETTEDQITLKGLIYERISETEMKISLTMKKGEGTKVEVFNMKKVE